MTYYDELSERIKEFESKVINFILSQLTQEEKEWYEKGKKERKIRSGYVPDLILPKGCSKLNFPINSVVEIKYGVSSEHLNRVYSGFKCMFNNRDYSFVLIYHSNSPTEYIHTNEKSVIVLRDDELFEYQRKRETRSHKKISLAEKIENCKKAFQNGNCTLFIGSGVSMSAKLPSWDELIRKTKDIVINAKKVEDEDIHEIEKLCGYSTVIEARYLRILAESEKEFQKHVKEALYSEGVNMQSELLLSIVNLISDTNFKGKIQKVITYNFDDLLEYAISKNGGVTPQVVVDKDCHIEENHLPIVHVHGVLPNYYKVAPPFSNTNIVFSEEAYHNLYNQPYSWANIEQMQALRSTICIFIGLSMNDPNLRRLLEVANKASFEDAREEKEKKRYHYAFLKREKGDAKKKVKHEEIMDKMFLELGVQVIWFDEFKELPDKLNSLLDTNN